MVARSVCWRAGRSRAPPVSKRKRLRRAAASSACGGKSRLRAAASSIASGSPSSRAQIAATAGALSARQAKSGITARARSTNSATAGLRSNAPVGGQPLQVGQRQRRHGIQALAPHVQRCPAGHQHLQPGTRLQQLHHQRRGVQHLLEVIEHQQPPLRLEHRREPLEQWPTGELADLQRLRDRRQHQRRVADRRERDKGRTVAEGREHVARDLEAQAGLADAGRPDQRQQAHLAVQQRIAHRGEVLFAPDQPA